MGDARIDDDQNSTDEVALLARLLGDAELRRRFVGDSQLVARELTDDSATIEFLMRLDHRQLENQAETLVAKRQHEVAELLPETWQQLGRTAISRFRNYVAESSWPDGHTRHIRDADAFAGWLFDQQIRELEIAEWNRLRFRLTERRLTLRIVTNGLILPRLQILLRKRDGRIVESLWGREWRRQVTR